MWVPMISQGMIGLVPFDELHGVMGDLFGKLVSSEGPVFAAELKKFVLKQPCWQTSTRDTDTPRDLRDGWMYWYFGSPGDPVPGPDHRDDRSCGCIWCQRYAE